MLRIPLSVVQKYVLKKGGQMRLEKPVPKKRPASEKPTVEDLARELARAVKQQHGEARRGSPSKALIEQIARHVQTLTFVPESDWNQLVFVETDDEDRE